MENVLTVKCKVMRIGRGKLIKQMEEKDGKIVSKNKIIHDTEPLNFFMTDTSTGLKHVLEETMVERDLGVLISNDLKSYAQSKKAAAKANSVLGQLKRSIIKFDKFTLKTLYTAIVRPHLEYASSAWSPYRSKDIKMLETIQRRATKLVPELRNKPYEKRLMELGLTTLKDRRERGDAIQYYKIINKINLVDWYHPNAFKPSNNTEGPANNIRNNKINNNQIYRQLTKTCDQREYFYSNRVVPIWNKLPNTVTGAKSVNNFKNEYDRFKRKQMEKLLKNA
jgi:ribonucleases P/MRP protein subunit RPP40